MSNIEDAFAELATLRADAARMRELDALVAEGPRPTTESDESRTATRAIGCTRCSKPAAMPGDRLPAPLCPWCECADRPGAFRVRDDEDRELLREQRDREKARADKAEAALYIDPEHRFTTWRERAEEAGVDLREARASADDLQALVLKREAEIRAIEADAAKWREAVAGKGDVERYARAAWETRGGAPWENVPQDTRDMYTCEARAVLALFRARAESFVADVPQSYTSPREWVRAALDFACSDVAEPECVCAETSTRNCPAHANLASDGYAVPAGGQPVVVLELAKRVNAAGLR